MYNVMCLLEDGAVVSFELDTSSRLHDCIKGREGILSQVKICTTHTDVNSVPLHVILIRLFENRDNYLCHILRPY